MPEMPHHITQRGNNRMDVFFTRELESKEAEENVGLLRMKTRTGRPLGSDSFVSKLESIAGRRLRPLPVGRQKKSN